MLRAWATTIAATIWLAGAVGAADSPGTATSNYIKFSEVAGTVTKVDKDSFTLRVTWYTMQQQNGSRGGNRSLRSGNHGRNSYYHPSRPRPAKAVEHHQDYNLTFASDGLVRFHKLSQEPGAGGGKFLPPAEQNKLKEPLGAPGWAADKSELTVGDVVDVHLVRPGGVKLSDLKETDLRVKYAIIWSENGSTPKLQNAPAKK